MKEKQVNNEIKSAVFTRAQKSKIKHQKVNLKDVQGCCIKNYKTLLREIKKDLYKSRYINYAHDWKSQYDKVRVLPKLIYGFNRILIKTPAASF